MCVAGVGCNDSGFPEFSSSERCAEECEIALPAFKVNIVELTNRADAPQPPTTPVTACAATDTDWPCVHVNSLNAYFTSDTGPICVDPADPDTCIRFEYAKHLFRADMPAFTDADCTDALTLADSDDGLATYGDWSAALADAVFACGDEAIYDEHLVNICLMDAPAVYAEGDTSFNSDAAPCCSPFAVNFVDVDRLPDPTSAAPLDFVQAASEHEMGHGFGLDHACDPTIPIDNPLPPLTNIMQSNAGQCCCESADASGRDTAGYWATDVCNDCSASPDAPGDCNNSPGEWNDPACAGGAWFSVGDRQDPFTDAVAGIWPGSDHPGQVEVILAEALTQCEFECETTDLKPNKFVKVAGEQECHPGVGRFALLPIHRVDLDQDGTGFVDLAPVSKSGAHLARVGWITSVSFVTWGDATHVAVPDGSSGWAFSATDPDLLDTATLKSFDPTHPSATFASGVLGTGFLWGVDGIPTADDSFSWPVVDLTWVCGGNPAGVEVLSETRPPNAYRLRGSDVNGTWTQELLIRPDYARMTAWVEARGYPRIATVVGLTQGTAGAYNWQLSALGLTASGTLKPAGTPSGAKLKFHLTSASYGTWSTSNVNPADLPKLP